MPCLYTGGCLLPGKKHVPDVEFELLTSIRDLRRTAAAWDDLWQRSESANPSAQAGPLALWIEQFAGEAPVRIVVVRERDSLLAALPLVGHGPGGFRAGMLPSNCWTSAGTLLVDPVPKVDAVLDCLVRGLRAVGWPLLRLDAVLPEAPAWREFGRALKRAGMPSLTRPRGSVDTIDVDCDWNKYLMFRSYNQKRQIRRMVARVGRQAHLRIVEEAGPDDLPRWLQQGFSIEDSGLERPRRRLGAEASGDVRVFCAAGAATGRRRAFAASLSGISRAGDRV